MQQQADIWRPAIISGAIFGFISGVPLLNLFNCLCCSLILGAGLMSSYMLVRASTMPLPYGRAALGGFVAGMIAAPASSITSSLFTIVLATNMQEEIRRSSQQLEQYFPDAGDAAQTLADIPQAILLLLMTLILIVFYAPFGALGGVIGRAIFERRTPSTMPPPPPPPAPPVEPAP